MLCTNSDTHFQKKQVIQTLLDRGMISIEAFDVGNDMVFAFFFLTTLPLSLAHRLPAKRNRLPAKLQRTRLPAKDEATQAPSQATFNKKLCLCRVLARC